MLFEWLNTREATEIGAALADDFVRQTASGSSAARHKSKAAAQGKEFQRALNKFLQQVDRDVRPLQLNALKKATLANSFKWRMLERGVDPQIVDELTRGVVMRLSEKPANPGARPAKRRAAYKQAAMHANGESFLSAGAHQEAIRCYEELLALSDRDAIARNNLGAALCGVGRFREAEEQFRAALRTRPRYAEAHCNLGAVLRWRGRIAESEMPLRRALKLKPTYVDAQINLSATLVFLGRPRDAKALLEQTLKTAPRNVAALVGMGQIAGNEGRFAEAETLFRRAAQFDPNAPSAWSALVGLRRMTPADNDWLKRAEQIAAGGLAPLSEATIRFAMGKYCDDVGDFARAFRSFSRANELQLMAAQTYDTEARTRFVDDMKRVYSRETLSRTHAGATDSMRPVFVIGMPRSGTSLVEQIIASHPRVRGAGELRFWADAVRRNAAAIRHEPPGESLVPKLAAEYLGVLTTHSGDALRVVDKTPFNTDYLGLIHTVFPRARVIYVRRDPIDTCLSCYFQEFSQDLNFAMDLSDLAHYYREHQRLVAHWRSALPPQTLLDIPYAALVGDQESWTRKIVNFIGLEWDERCLDFHRTDRTVSTASYWQVRQKMYQSSVGRWRNYEKFIGPLLDLRDADS
jgi:tetratricopeptide (TPR) repeat protein